MLPLRLQLPLPRMNERRHLPIGTNQMKISITIESKILEKKSFDLMNMVVKHDNYDNMLVHTPIWAEGGVDTGEHPPNDVKLEDDKVPPIPL